MANELFCGCCGNSINPGTRSDPDWCARCRTHVAGGVAPAWERTWYARHRAECPFQVRADALAVAKAYMYSENAEAAEEAALRLIRSLDPEDHRQEQP